MNPNIDWESLKKAALEARTNAYAPYSKFLVGAALLLKNGTIVTGVNVENASYGLAICAERTAIFTARTSHDLKPGDIQALVIATDHNPPVSPCGACRQVIKEFADQLPIMLINLEGNQIETNIQELLPLAFTSTFQD